MFDDVPKDAFTVGTLAVTFTVGTLAVTFTPVLTPAEPVAVVLTPAEPVVFTPVVTAGIFGTVALIPTEPLTDPAADALTAGVLATIACKILLAAALAGAGAASPNPVFKLEIRLAAAVLVLAIDHIPWDKSLVYLTHESP